MVKRWKLKRWTNEWNGNQRRDERRDLPFSKATIFKRKGLETIHFFSGEVLVLLGGGVHFLTPKNVPPNKLSWNWTKRIQDRHHFLWKKRCFRLCFLELLVQFQEMYTVDLHHEKFDSLFTTIQGFLKNHSQILDETTIQFFHNIQRNEQTRPFWKTSARYENTKKPTASSTGLGPTCASSTIMTWRIGVVDDCRAEIDSLSWN